MIETAAFTSEFYGHTDTEHLDDESMWEPLFPEERMALSKNNGDLAICIFSKNGKLESGYVSPNSSHPPFVETDLNPGRQEHFDSNLIINLDYHLFLDEYRNMKTIISSPRCDATLSRLGDSLEVEAELVRVLQPLLCGNRCDYPDVTEPPNVRDFEVSNFLGEPVTLTLRISSTSVEISKAYRNRPAQLTPF